MNFKFFQNNGFSRRAAVATVAASILIGCFALLIWRAQTAASRALDSARQKQPFQHEIQFTKIVHRPLDTSEIQIWQNTNGVRDIAVFNRSIFAATDGGLIQFAPDGKFVRHFTNLDGLPDSDLTVLAAFQNRLFIGTNAHGLIEFDGENFASYKWRNLEAKAVTALLADDARLLVGTLRAVCSNLMALGFVKSSLRTIEFQPLTCSPKKAKRCLSELSQTVCG